MWPQVGSFEAFILVVIETDLRAASTMGSWWCGQLSLLYETLDHCFSQWGSSVFLFPILFLCLNFVSIALMIHTMTKSYLGRKALILLYISQPMVHP